MKAASTPFFKTQEVSECLETRVLVKFVGIRWKPMRSTLAHGLPWGAAREAEFPGKHSSLRKWKQKPVFVCDCGTVKSSVCPGKTPIKS